MTLLFSLYSGFLLIFCVVAASLMFASYKVSKNKGCLYAMCTLVFCALDYFLLILGDALDFYPAFLFDELYTIVLPLMLSLISTGFVLGIWLLVCRYFNETNHILAFGPPALFLCISLFVAFTGEDNNVLQFIYYACKKAFLLGVTCFSVLKYKLLPEGAGKINFKKYAPIIAALSILVIATLLEDVSRFLLENYYAYLGETYLAYYLTERNFSGDLFVLFFGFLCICRSLLHLSLRNNEVLPIDKQLKASKEMSVIMPRFQDRYALTPRELEILEQLLRGKSNQEIATELFISIGTVKAHTHNLFSKTDCSSRQELKEAFWSL